MTDLVKFGLDDLVDVLKAAGEPTRLRLLALLAAGDLTVTDLTEILGQSQPRISRHLKLLGEAGLIDRYQEGAWAYFRLKQEGKAVVLVRTLLRHAAESDPVLLRDGEKSSRHVQVVALARTLVALDGAAGRAVGGPVAKGLVNLEEALAQCAHSSGLDPRAAEEWLAGFARAMAFPDAARGPAEVPVVAAGDAEDEGALRLVGGTDTLAYDAAVAAMMRELEPGAWLRLVDESGKEASVKLAWISPLTGRRLLVDRRGLRQLVASPEQMAALAAEGRLALNATTSPFDEAMRAVRRQLAAAAA